MKITLTDEQLNSINEQAAEKIYEAQCVIDIYRKKNRELRDRAHSIAVQEREGRGEYESLQDKYLKLVDTGMMCRDEYLEMKKFNAQIQSDCMKQAAQIIDKDEEIKELKAAIRALDAGEQREGEVLPEVYNITVESGAPYVMSISCPCGHDLGDMLIEDYLVSYAYNCTCGRKYVARRRVS